jgi:hypothetical protein
MFINMILINKVNDATGVKCCHGYGMCFFVLKEVRLRTTFASHDTGDCN